MRQTIAQNMLKIMKQKNLSCVWYGDLDIIEECAKKSGVIKQHPKNTIQTVLNALDKSCFFRKGYIIADFDGIQRKYRSFTICTHNPP